MGDIHTLPMSASRPKTPRNIMVWTTKQPDTEGYYWAWDGAITMIEAVPDGHGNFNAWIEDRMFPMHKFLNFIGPIQVPDPPNV